MDVVIGRIRAQHRSGCRGTLFLRVVVVLDADSPEYGVTMVRDISGRVDVGCAGPAAFVNQNTVVLGDRLAFSDRAQVVDTRQASPRNIEPPVPATRGDQ